MIRRQFGELASIDIARNVKNAFENCQHKTLVGIARKQEEKCENIIDHGREIAEDLTRAVVVSMK